MIEPDDSDEAGEEWKHSAAENNKNNIDMQSKIIVNSHSQVPFLYDNWKITENESMRVDIFHKNTHFSLVLGERPYLEVYRCDNFGQLILPPERIFDLGPYFNE